VQQQHWRQASTVPLSKSFAATAGEEPVFYKKPPSLKQGDLIGITAPAGSIKSEEIQPALAVMQSWGYEIRAGDTIGKKDFTFGGTDEERLNDLQKMLDDPKIKAIMCARGGYGVLTHCRQNKLDKIQNETKMADRV
jgi:muramoyltetrapeptide carboxypeptidase